MSRLITRNEIKAGHTFYVITEINTIESYRVIRRRGEKFAIVSEGGPICAAAAGNLINCIGKFRTRGAVVRYAKLYAIPLNLTQ